MMILKRDFLKLFILSLFITCSQFLVAQNLNKVQVDAKYKKQFKSLISKKSTKADLEFIQSDSELSNKELIALNEIPAPPFEEDNRGLAFKKLLETYGVDTAWIDAAGNVIGLLKGTEDRYVAIDAHLDTVFPIDTDVSVQFLGDTLYAPGIGDDTRGLAVVLSVLRTVKQSKLKPASNLYFIGSVGEEGLGDLSGVKYIFSDQGIKVDSWVSVDGGGLGRITNKALGSLRYRVTFKGSGGHSWGNFGIVNPHHALGAAIQKFVIVADEYTKEGPKTSYNIGRIGGGTSVNSVPFASWMEVDMRSVDPVRLKRMDEILRVAVTEALKEQNNIKRSGRELEVELTEIGNRPSGELPENLPLVQNALAVLDYFDIDPSLSRGSTNANIPISMGIPAITIGRGGIGGGAHSLNEWWLDKEGYKAVQFAYLILMMEAGF